MRPTGKINLMAVVIVAGLCGGLFWIVNYASAYLDNLDVRDAVRGAYNSAWHQPDSQLQFEILNKVNSSQVGWHEEDDEFGAPQHKRGLGIKPEEVEIERDDVNKTISIKVSYKRKVYLWPWPNKNNVRWLSFSETKTGAIKSPEAW
jgi:hypothetical protein